MRLWNMIVKDGLAIEGLEIDKTGIIPMDGDDFAQLLWRRRLALVIFCFFQNFIKQPKTIPGCTYRKCVKSGPLCKRHKSETTVCTVENFVELYTRTAHIEQCCSGHPHPSIEEVGDYYYLIFTCKSNPYVPTARGL